MKISLNTVETAYEHLVAEGYVTSKPRKGYFVLAYEELAYIDKTVPGMEKEPVEQENYLYDFHPSRIDTENFPFDKWRKYAKNIMDKENQSLLLLGDSLGDFELRRKLLTIYTGKGSQMFGGANCSRSRY